MDFSQVELMKGNENVFNDIFKEYYPLLCSVSYQYNKDIQLSELIAQDVLLMLWEKRKIILPVTSLKAYLLTSTRNLSIDYIRSSKDNLFLDLDTATSHSFLREEDVFEQYVFEELEKVIYEKIALLPDKSREVFSLSRFEDKSYSEIAEALGISENTVKYHIKNSLAFLRDELKGYLLFLPFIILSILEEM